MTYTKHVCSFKRGKNWHTYRYLETRVLECSRYVAFAQENSKTWSETFADLLMLTGSAIDSFLRYMKDCPVISNLPEVAKVSLRIRKRKTKQWNIGDFMSAYEPVYEFSQNHVLVPFGLSNFGKREPFRGFEKRKSPIWWKAYNHLKHDYYEKIREATLENTLDALAALLILNTLHKDSQEHLVRLMLLKSAERFTEGLSPKALLGNLQKSKIGIPNSTPVFKCWIQTPIFLFELRKDPAL